MSIEIIDLHKNYGGRAAVAGMSLSIRTGEIFGLLGVNGAGKTTTLKLLTGILRPTSGQVFFGSKKLCPTSSQAKQIVGYVPDRPHLYPKLTVREVLRFCGNLYNISKAELESRINEAISEYALKGLEDSYIESLSHGMKQRVSTSAAILHKPEILVIDEPMVGLDPHGSKLLKSRLKHYAAAGMTIVLSTHSLGVAQEIADRLAIIDSGKILALGTLDELRAMVNDGDTSDLESIFLSLTAQV